MNVFVGTQAKEMKKYPNNSIGVFEAEEGWAYWYNVDGVFDFGVKESEVEAFKIAKTNHK